MENVERKMSADEYPEDNFTEAARFAGITASQACQFSMYMDYLLGKGPAPGFLPAEKEQRQGEHGCPRCGSGFVTRRNMVISDGEPKRCVHFWHFGDQPTSPQSASEAQPLANQFCDEMIQNLRHNVGKQREAQREEEAQQPSAVEMPEPNWKDIALSLTDDEVCRYDHHGYCQTHSLHEKPCPHEVVQQWAEAARKEGGE